MWEPSRTQFDQVFCDQVNINVSQFEFILLLFKFQFNKFSIPFVPLFGQRINAMFLVTFNVLTGFAHGIVCG